MFNAYVSCHHVPSDTLKWYRRRFYSVMHLTEFMRTLHSVDSRYRSANSKIPPISLDIFACFHIYATAFRPYPRYVTIVLILESIGGNSSTRYSDSLVIKHGNSSPPSLPGCLRGLTSHAIYGTVCKQLTLASVTYSSHCTVLFFCQTQGICEARVRRDSEVNLIGDIQARRWLRPENLMANVSLRLTVRGRAFWKSAS